MASYIDCLIADHDRDYESESCDYMLTYLSSIENETDIIISGHTHKSNIEKKMKFF